MSDLEDIRLKYKAILIPVEKLEENPWNPNEMSADTFALLKVEMTKEFVGAILVRPSPDPEKAKQGFYQIIDGAHRWRASAAAEVGYKAIPCIVVEKSDDDAQKLTYLRNVLHGEINPLKLAVLLENWRKVKTPTQVFQEVGLMERQQERLLEKLKAPEGRVVEEAARVTRRTFVAVLTEEDYNLVMRAVKMTREWNIEEGLLKVCQEYLGCSLREKIQKEAALLMLKELDAGKALVDICSHYVKCGDARSALRAELMKWYGVAESPGSSSEGVPKP